MQPENTSNNPYHQIDSSRTEQPQIGQNIQQTQQWNNQNQQPQSGYPIQQQYYVPNQPMQQQQWAGNQPMQQQQWAGQYTQVMPAGVVVIQQTTNIDDVSQRADILSSRKCLLIYLTILISLLFIQFIADLSYGSFSYTSIVVIAFYFFMIYGVYTYNSGLITLGLVLCYIGIVILFIAFVLAILALIVAANHISDSNIEINGEIVTNVGAFVAITICLVLIPITIAIIIEILLIINYGKLRNGLSAWRSSHKGQDFQAVQDV